MNESYLERVVYRQPYGWTYENVNTTYRFSFEEFDPFWWASFVLSNWKLPLYVGAVYIVTIFGLKNYMKNRPAFELTTPLFLWNLGLSIFSVVGFFRVLQNVLEIMGEENGFYTIICRKTHGSIPACYWILLFLLSKFVELGDTIFVVLRKRPLVFLQWYHHLVTMCVCWILAPYMEPLNRWFAFMNYGVHSLMYPYFAFKAIGVKIPRSVANCITILQLAQMIFGLFVNMLTMHYYQIGRDCFKHHSSIKVFGVVYGSFLILFGKLFYDTVIIAHMKQEKSEKVPVKKD